MTNQLREFFGEGSRISVSALRRYAKTTRFYLMFIIPRSGSTWLAEMMGEAGKLGAPHEAFNIDFMRSPEFERPRDLDAHIRNTVKLHSSPFGVAGTQLSHLQAIGLMELLDEPLDPDFFEAVYYLRRRDFLAQAVSMDRSARSGLFHSTQSDENLKRSFDETPYDSEALAVTLTYLLQSEVGMEKIFQRCGYRPVRIYYEDLVEDPARELRIISEALGFKGPAAPPPTSFERLADSKSAEWVERFCKERPEFVEAVNRQRPPLLSMSDDCFRQRVSAD